jgi:hypothetical protein
MWQNNNISSWREGPTLSRPNHQWNLDLVDLNTLDPKLRYYVEQQTQWAPKHHIPKPLDMDFDLGPEEFPPLAPQPTRTVPHNNHTTSRPDHVIRLMDIQFPPNFRIHGRENFWIQGRTGSNTHVLEPVSNSI